MKPYGTEAPEVDPTDEEEFDSAEARVRLHAYRDKINKDAEEGVISFLVAEACHGVANAIEDLYNAIDGYPVAEADASTSAEDHDGSDPGGSEGVEVDGEEVVPSEEVGTPSGDEVGGTRGYAVWIPPPPYRQPT